MVLNEKENVHRLVICSFYDKDGIVDDYIPYLLKDIKKNASEIMLVSNGVLTEESKAKLSGIADVILERENKGFDFGGYKAGIEYYCWEKISEYDELIICNSTVYGPFYPFSDMFGEMNKRDIDFWGITQYHMNKDYSKQEVFPDHIQSYFMAFRKNIFSSKEFQKYWETLNPINSYAEAAVKNEADLTKKFENLGYNWDVYIHTNDLKDYSVNPFVFYPLELLRDRKCPVINAESFKLEYNKNLANARGMSMIGLIEYINKFTDYNADLILDNILRTGNIGTIKNHLHLNYILPKYYQNSNPDQEKTALFMHIYFEDQIDKMFKYSQNVPKWFDIIITTDTEKKKQAIERRFSEINCNKLSIMLVKNRGRDVSALFVGLRQYVFDYSFICFIHDKKSAHARKLSLGEHFADKCYENLLCSTEYINNIIGLFQQDKRLGVLIPPAPNQGSFVKLPGREWTCNFENMIKLAEKLDINVDMDNNIPPVAPLGSMFWFRPKALKKLFSKKWEYEDFEEEPMGVDGTISHAIERIYCFAAQSELYYSGSVINDEYAEAELTVLCNLLQEKERTIAEYKRLYPVYKRFARFILNKCCPLKTKRRELFEKYYLRFRH